MVANIINIGAACGEMSREVCSKALATQMRPLFIIAGALVLLYVVIQVVTFLTTAKKAATLKTFWTSIVLIDVLMLVSLLILYLALPMLIRAFNIV